jgi:hypothetical protein
MMDLTNHGFLPWQHEITRTPQAYRVKLTAPKDQKAAVWPA